MGDVAGDRGNPAIVKSPGPASEFADTFPEVVGGSPEELGTILSVRYDEWKRYRDQVVGDDRRSHETFARGRLLAPEWNL